MITHLSFLDMFYEFPPIYRITFFSVLTEIWLDDSSKDVEQRRFSNAIWPAKASDAACNDRREAIKPEALFATFLGVSVKQVLASIFFKDILTWIALVGQIFAQMPHLMQNSEWMMIWFVDSLTRIGISIFSSTFFFFRALILTGHLVMHGRPHWVIEQRW